MAFSRVRGYIVKELGGLFVGVLLIFMGLVDVTGGGMYHGYPVPPVVGFFWILIGILMVVYARKKNQV